MAMALLHLDPEDRLRIARYFDPPMYFLVGDRRDEAPTAGPTAMAWSPSGA